MVMTRHLVDCEDVLVAAVVRQVLVRRTRRDEIRALTIPCPAGSGPFTVRVELAVKPCPDGVGAVVDESAPRF